MLAAGDPELSHLAGLPTDEFARDEGAAFRLLASLRRRGWEVTVQSDADYTSWSAL